MTTPQKENNRGLQAKVFTIAIAIILSASVIPFIYKASTTLAESRNDLKDKHERNAENFLLECQQLAKEGAYEVAIEKILTIKPKTLKPSLRNKWYIAITNIFYSKAKNYPQKRHSAINQALTFAQKGIILSQDPEVQHNLTFIKAELYILNEQWTAAIENLEILDTSTSNPMKRWGIRLKTAECLTQLKKYTYALKILESIIDETDEEDIWAKATFLHANLLWTNINHINSPQIKTNAIADQSLLTQSINQLTQKKELENKILVEFEDLVKNTSANNDTIKLIALHKILEIHVGRAITYPSQKEINASYSTANQLKAASGGLPFSAPAYALMAELELSRNKIDRSNSYLTKLIRNHPQHPLTSKTFLKFYHILKKQKEWDRALYLAYQVANVNIENNTKLKLVEDLGLQEGSLLNQLNLKNPRTKKFIESIITSAKAQNTYDQSLILYAQSCYQLQLGNYYEADIKFSKYLRTPSFQKYNETIYYNYLLSSVKAKQPPIIRALRSRLYLNNHFDRNRSQTVMLHLMDAYFDMGLWEESIAAAKKIFNSEIKRMGIEKDHYKASDEWLKAIARIGQSYHFNDQDNKAQELFSIFTKQFKASPNAAEIFVDWAATAAQHRPYESIERLDVIIPHINNSADFLRLTSLRNVKRLELNIEKSRSEAYNLLKLLKEKNKLLDTRTKKDLSLQIHKALFNNTITYYPEDIDKIKEILLSSVKEFPQDTWPYASILQWHTKSTNKENKKTINNIISKLKSGPAPAHDNIQSTEALKKHTELLKALEGKNLF